MLHGYSRLICPRVPSGSVLCLPSHHRTDGITGARHQIQLLIWVLQRSSNRPACIGTLSPADPSSWPSKHFYINISGKSWFISLALLRMTLLPLQGKHLGHLYINRYGQTVLLRIYTTLHLFLNFPYSILLLFHDLPPKFILSFLKSSMRNKAQKDFLNVEWGNQDAHTFPVFLLFICTITPVSWRFFLVPFSPPKYFLLTDNVT